MGIEQINVVDSVWYYWILFIFAAIVGSTASSLTNGSGKAMMYGWEGGNPKGENGNPGKYCLGIISDIIIGIAAALGILWTLTPQTVIQLIGLGTVAGYGGSSVLRALTNKIDAQLSQQEANKAIKEAQNNKDEADKNKFLDESSSLDLKEAEKNIQAIKSYLVENNKQLLEELYNKNLLK